MKAISPTCGVETTCPPAFKIFCLRYDTPPDAGIAELAPANIAQSLTKSAHHPSVYPNIAPVL